MRRFGQDRLKARIAHSFNAVSDTYTGIKDVFEQHRVVLTLAASLGSAAAAWAGYTARQLHQKKVEERLNSIEHTISVVHKLDEAELKGLTNVGVRLTSCIATAGTTLIIGYGLGWRGGRQSMMKKLQRQQVKTVDSKKLSLFAFKRQLPSFSKHDRLSLLTKLKFQSKNPKKGSLK